MVQWHDKGVLLKARPYGDRAWVVHFLTSQRGRFAGLVRGGRETKSALQLGSVCALAWTSRLEDQLGLYAVEVEQAIAPRVLDDPLRLLGLIASLSLIDRSLPERDPAPALFAALRAWVDLLEGPYWGQTLVRLELGLLAHLGYGLDLSQCVVTGTKDQLTHVSPKSGTAVCREAAEPFKAKLLPIPSFLQTNADKGENEAKDLILGLNLSGYFLHHRLFAALNQGIPEERLRLVEKIEKQAEQSSLSPASGFAETQDLKGEAPL